MASRVHILDEFVSEGRDTFTSSALRERLGLSGPATSNLLSRWVHQGLVDRVARGQYAVRPLGALGTRAASQDVALAVAAAFRDVPHRVAFRSALDHHDLLTHPARTIQIATPVQKSLRSISGRKLRVVTEPESTVGIGAEPAGYGAMVSSHARALLDVASRPDLGGGPAVLAEALIARRIDAVQLRELARRLEAAAALRRIGSIADQLEIPGLAGKLRPLTLPRSDLDLDPQDPHREYRDTRWWVAWPIHPDDLAADVQQ